MAVLNNSATKPPVFHSFTPLKRILRQTGIRAYATSRGGCLTHRVEIIVQILELTAKMRPVRVITLHLQRDPLVLLVVSRLIHFAPTRIGADGTKVTPAHCTISHPSSREDAS
jgi:hypothetical protein